MSLFALMGWAALSTGEELDRNATEHESGGGDKPLLKKGTVLLMACEKVREDTFDNQETGLEERTYSIQWKCMSGEHLNRVEFQRLKLFDEKDATRDNAIKMLNAIDNNLSGGKAMAMDHMPEAEELEQLWQNKMALVQFDVWKNPDEDEPDGFKRGNWVKKIANRKSKPEPKEVHANKDDAAAAALAKVKAQDKAKQQTTSNKPANDKPAVTGTVISETAAEKKARMKRELEEMERQEQLEAEVSAAEQAINDEPSDSAEDPGY